MKAMIRISLKPATRKQLPHRLHQSFQSGDRRLIKRITALLWCADGVPVATIAERIAVSLTTGYDWIAAVLARSFASLVYRRSPGRRARFGKHQKQQRCALIEAGPEAAGYATGCWTSAVIQDMIWTTVGVTYRIHSISELVRTLGFSYQKARCVAAGQNEEVRRTGQTHHWPHIVQEARRTGALVLFGDEASFAQWGSLGYTWARRGMQPEVKTSGVRKSSKVFGVIDYFRGRVCFEGGTERFPANSSEAFLTRVRTETTQPIILIQDGARYHTSKAMQTCFTTQAHRLTGYQLPSYSPDYTPMEHLWRNSKRDKTHTTYFPTFESLVVAVETGLSHYHAQPERVKQLMGTCLDNVVPSELPAV